MEVRFAAAGLAGLISLAAVAPALAQPNSPVVRWAQRTAGPGEFYLNSSDEREIIRYSTPRDVRLCLPMDNSAPGEAPSAVPVTVSWEGVRATLYPGNCMYFDARRVSVSPAAPLPRGATIHGIVETTPIYAR